MNTTRTAGRWELTATKDDGRTVKTTYHPTRKAAEAAAWEALGWGWATMITKTGSR